MVRCFCLALVFVSLLCSPVAADQITEAFPYLNKFKHFGISFYYQKNKSQILDQKLPDDRVKVMLTSLDKSAEKYLIVFDPGPSGDPSFSFYKADAQEGPPLDIRLSGGETYPQVNGLDLVMPGNGIIYVAGHTNEMFNKRRKLRLVQGELVEVDQPFYYVGLQTVTTKAIKLYGSKKKDRVVAYLPKGAKVEVLANQQDFYLVRTPFGLAGWLEIPFGTLWGQSPLKDIVFAGD
jgi:hypothetical protein